METVTEQEQLASDIANASFTSPRPLLLAKNLSLHGTLETPRTLAQFAETIRSCGLRIVAEKDGMEALKLLETLGHTEAARLRANCVEVENNFR